MRSEKVTERKPWMIVACKGIRIKEGMKTNFKIYTYITQTEKDKYLLSTKSETQNKKMQIQQNDQCEETESNITYSSDFLKI